jgi:hypothetical protein
MPLTFQEMIFIGRVGRMWSQYMGHSQGVQEKYFL